MEPHEYPRRILLSVSGLSPQIITETLFALTQTSAPAFVPTEVHLLTTRRGADHARKTLLGADPGWFHRLCRDYGLSGIHFDEKNICTIRDRNGDDLDDIRTQEDNEYAADQIVEYVRKLCQDHNAAMHVSIAGGRKTMGYYVGYALSLFGRRQDRLSHVLISDLFEGHPEFFYPACERRIIYARNKDETPIDTSEAKVMLASIPFVRLRLGLDQSLIKGRTTFTRAVGETQRSLNFAELVIDSENGRIRCGDKIIKLKPAEHAFLAWFARRAQSGRPGISRKGFSADDMKEFQREYSELPGSRNDNADIGKIRLTHEAFSEHKSRIEAALIRVLGSKVAEPYLIQKDGGKPARFFLTLKPQQIRFEHVEADAKPRSRRKSRGTQK